MKKRIFKQGMALMLAAALALPANVVPAEILDQQTETELPHIVLNQETPDEKVTDSDAKEKEEQTGTQTETKTKTEVNATETAEQIIYNTGSFNVHVVSEEDFENDLGDACFEEDGSYTINIPEENPFFPYEVQFTYDGKTENEWFMNPEDSIEIDGHTFYVSASFDGTAVTQLTMDVGGQEVVVYPKEKEFTDGDGVALMSLLPLEERNLSLDLSGFTPIELACVKPATVFKGENQIGTETEILWKPRDSRDNYESDPDSVGVVAMDLAFNTSGATSTSWEMIVGNPDQLDASNIRYYVDIAVTDTENWLIPTVTIHNDDGTTKNVTVTDAYYSDYAFSRRMHVDVPTEEVKGNTEMTVSLKINSDLFERSVISKIETHSLSSEVSPEAVKKDDGWYLEITGERSRISHSVFRMNGYDKNDQVLGDAFDFKLYLSSESDHIYTSLYDKTGNSISYSTSWEEDEEDPWMEEKLVYNLGASYADNDTYRLVLTFEKAVATSENQIIGAFIGRYESIDAAKAAGAVDVKESLFNQTQGYEADFSKGVYVSVFSGKADDDSRKLKRYVWHIYTRSEAFLDNSTAVSFYGINDAQGNYVACKVLNPSYGDYKDDYADFSYITILVGEDTDLTSLAPVFTMQNGMKLYTNKEEISGQSLHDFSNGPVHYTASAENSKNAKNYWLQIIKPKQGESWLYMNSLADESSDTREENGVVYTTREAMLNSIHDYEHRIILANMGTKALSKLSVEAEGALFDSWVVTLDNYWTLKGEHDLSGYQGLGYDELANLAKLKLVYDGDEINGQDLTGTLTIKEAGKPIMVINLTGVVGDPGIVTTEIPDAVKYVHYGSMIQNSNKYDFNTVSYKITDGKLPSGMELKPNGELYGVPLETGEFTFTVQMKNSYSEFANVTKEFTLKVVDNTDANVDSAVDQGYDLKERVPNILLSDNNDYTMTSIGVIEEWDNLTLDGKRLVEGVDFDAKSGSTRLTIRSQTLKANNQVGTHTLSAEFREKGTGNLKRAAQNYRVGRKSSGGSSGGGHSSSGRATVRADYGNIGADGAWVQDAKGWKCKAADGTWYTDCWKELNYQNEKSWYRFDAQGYLVTGWYQDNGTWYYLNPKSDGKLGKMMTGWQYINDIWYYFTENAGDKQGAMFCKRWAEVPYNGTVEWYYFDENGTMKTDWLTQDENKFYLYPIADGTRGRMLTGWQKIGDNWYYFHEESDGNKGVLARRTKIGNYYVNSDGVWAK
ncbi:putative Ig domain-containing protein [Pilosibacter fragilis]|jgi:glucan-binding YG repeat protein|uniref:Ig domain-containing protein n=1 Tax=Pilosibacter fragilis TaxID=3078042 RepID=UPI0032D4A136